MHRPTKYFDKVIFYIGFYNVILNCELQTNKTTSEEIEMAELCDVICLFPFVTVHFTLEIIEILDVIIFYFLI
jgi:hypothetical protein